jgi:transposase-like protein
MEVPRAITFDRYAASHQAVAKLKAAGTLPRRVRIRSCKYLNNVTLARPSPDKTAGPADARIQAIRDGGRDDLRH